MAKRMILEWGLLLCLGTAFALLTLWIVYRFFDRSSYHLRISTTGNLRHDLHLFLYDGQFALSNQFDRDSSGRIRPLIVEAKALIRRDILRGDRCGQLMIPGLNLRYYWNAPSRGLIWSLEQSLLIPVVLLLLLTAWFRIRLGKLKALTSHSSPQALEGQTDVAGGREIDLRNRFSKSRIVSTRVGADRRARDDARTWNE